mmetsp:Transcript_29815/g.47817  ORF Transcript_29815/g.47817 Transcript_29815/m.47817 type:complete len:323 (+) Transcript_29815:332-1300(+)
MPGQRYVDDYDYFLRRNKGRSPRKTKFNEKMPLKRRKRRPSRGCDHDYFCRVYFMSIILISLLTTGIVFALKGGPSLDEFFRCSNPASSQDLCYDSEFGGISKVIRGARVVGIECGKYARAVGNGCMYCASTIGEGCADGAKIVSRKFAGFIYGAGDNTRRPLSAITDDDDDSPYGRYYGYGSYNGEGDSARSRSSSSGGGGSKKRSADMPKRKAASSSSSPSSSPSSSSSTSTQLSSLWGLAMGSGSAKPKVEKQRPAGFFEIAMRPSRPYRNVIGELFGAATFVPRQAGKAVARMLRRQPRPHKQPQPKMSKKGARRAQR